MIRERKGNMKCRLLMLEVGRQSREKRDRRRGGGNGNK
jgi:hypothetical protein